MQGRMFFPSLGQVSLIFSLTIMLRYLIWILVLMEVQNDS